MRMWAVDPAFLCRKHLLGEHLELHMFQGILEKREGIDLTGFYYLVETYNLQSRHECLVEEMFRRGYYGHKTPMTYEDELKFGEIDVEFNIYDLYCRCEECRLRIYHYTPHVYEGWVKNGTPKDPRT